MVENLSTYGRQPPISRPRLLAILTMLMEAMPPLNITQAQIESKISTYLEILSKWWPEEEISLAVNHGLRTQWKFFPTIMEIEKECRKVAHSRWEETQSQVQALIPEKFQETPEEKDENLKLIADLKSHFKANEPPEVEKASMTDREVLTGLKRLAAQWDANA